MEVITMLNKTIKLITLIITAAFLCSCNGTKAHVTNLVFIDYSTSATTLEGTNPARLINRLETVWDSMNEDDIITIYPIHLLTESANPLIKLVKPELRGDLTDKQREKDMLEKFLIDVDKVLFKENEIRSDVRMGTNIYPIVRKLAEYHKEETPKVWVVSDMKHEFADEQLHLNLFEPKSKPADHAKIIVDREKYLGILSNVQFIVAFPETCDHIDEILRPKLTAFWREFFQLSGAEVLFDYL